MAPAARAARAEGKTDLRFSGHGDSDDDGSTLRGGAAEASRREGASPPRPCGLTPGVFCQDEGPDTAYSAACFRALSIGPR